MAVPSIRSTNPASAVHRVASPLPVKARRDDGALTIVLRLEDGVVAFTVTIADWTGTPVHTSCSVAREIV